jgi:acetyl esterase/lipase
MCNLKKKYIMKTTSSIIVLILCVLLVTSVPGCGSKQKGGNDTVFVPPDSLVYKTTLQGELKMYLTYPENWKTDGNYPAMVFFFGGGWRGGNIDHFKTQAEYFASRGMVTARADYRVLNRHGTTPEKCVEDGKSAIRWIRENAKELGLDPNRIVASGGSSGGHVAACTWTVDGFEAEGDNLTVSSKPDLLVLFNPVMNTTHERIVERLDSEEIARMISPNDHLSSETPPMIMFFGSEDILIEDAYTTLEISSELGNHAELWIAEGEKHGFFNQSPWNEWTIFLADSFLKQQGYLKEIPGITLPDSVEMKLFNPVDPFGQE